ncbi:MAG: hypothetical protein OES38_14815, partial [Gammaproteobacteria bacterium]|nr:hypothetical protein [Gammaproteobacteria bacterium]
MSKPTPSKFARLRTTFGCLLMFGVVTGCGAEPQISCSEVNGIAPVCGFSNPEDLAVVPGGEYLLVSEMGPFM